ncbi:tyrosine-type recombinase/integrase [Falsirhodobacter algicola]|uniref:Tyrosine-type recombinase/integrase n=1 Tax=Falsirhodobacter algicola TaxID=2692330 RepID=A0A8J8MTM4_9RHOB|nr:tyrosine-type recombinase/integrase [Falsirhodobacter algicola]QUS36186.1 tyrosine-type recombinase/integrase [Falsirhodobacter algicola]
MGSGLKRSRQYPGATSYFDRHGKRRWRFRKGGFSVELGSEYGSEDFIGRYEAALEGHRTRGGVGAGRAKPGSVELLVLKWYRSQDFLALEASTQRVYRGVVENFRQQHGDKPVHLMQLRHVQDLLAAKADTPAAANNLRKRLIQLLDYAITLEWRTDNPARATKPYKVATEGFHTWTEAEIAQFIRVHPQGTEAHTVMTLMLYTGAARVDAVQLGPWNIKDGRFRYRRQKTKKSNGQLISIPLHPDLASVLATLASDRPFISTSRGTARSVGGLGNLMQRWTKEAGLPACSSHGLRKACARRLAEAGATTNQIAAVTGHKSLALVQHYTAAAEREGLADTAFEKLITRPNGEQNLANHSGRFAKTTNKPMKEKR